MNKILSLTLSSLLVFQFALTTKAANQIETTFVQQQREYLAEEKQKLIQLQEALINSTEEKSMIKFTMAASAFTAIGTAVTSVLLGSIFRFSGSQIMKSGAGFTATFLILGTAFVFSVYKIIDGTVEIYITNSEAAELKKQILKAKLNIEQQQAALNKI